MEEDGAESTSAKRRKLDPDAPAPPKALGQRVTSKGKNVPVSLDTFQALKERYHCPSLILSNLAKNGWDNPTGIQAHGIPILMEVRS